MNAIKARAIEIFNATKDNAEIIDYITKTMAISYEGKHEGFIDFKYNTIIEVVSEMLVEIYYGEDWDGQEDTDAFTEASVMLYDDNYEDALDAVKDRMEYEKDIYKYHGVKRSDF